MMNRFGCATFATAFACLLTSAAAAHEIADLNILGFSEDGSVFAFEEYIHTDFADIFGKRVYINTHTGKLLSGAPVQVAIDLNEDNDADIETVRSQVARQGERIFPAAQLSPLRGQKVASAGLFQQTLSHQRMVALPRAIFPPIDKPLVIELEQTKQAAATASDECENEAFFRLVRKASPDTGKATVLLDNLRVIEGYCYDEPRAYNLAAIHTYYPDKGPPVFVVMLSTEIDWLEGPLYRWEAVAGKL